MKALEILYRDKKWIEEECDISKIPIERMQTMIKDLVEIKEAIAELEALQQPKSCEGCKYQIHKVDDVQQNGNWMKYSVFYDCGHDNNCKRNTADRYEPKEEA